MHSHLHLLVLIIVRDGHRLLQVLAGQRNATRVHQQESDRVVREGDRAVRAGLEQTKATNKQHRETQKGEEGVRVSGGETSGWMLPPFASSLVAALIVSS